MSIRQTKPVVRRTLTVFGSTIVESGHTHLQSLQTVKSVDNYDTTLTLRYENITSVSSPKAKVVHFVKWRPRKPIKLGLKPRRPVFNPPKLPVYREPLAYSGKSQNSAAINFRRRQKASLRFQEAFSRTVVKRGIYIKLYELRFAKFEKRLLRYNSILVKLQRGVPKRVTVRSSDRVWNPYSRTRISETGSIYNVDTEYRARVVSYCSHGIPTSFSATNPDRITWRSTERGISTYVVTQPTPAFIATVTDSATNQAVAKLHSKLKDEAVHIGNFFAERHQTMSMLAGAVKGLAEALRAKRKFFSVIASKFSSPKDIADATLAIQFGVKPLISDVYSAAEGLVKLQNQKPTVRVRTVSSCHDSIVVKAVNPGSVYLETTKVTVKVSYVLEYRVSSAVLNGLSQWGLVNPAEIAWEILPWSFAIDWVLPIGGWISSLSSDAGLDFIRGSKVVTTTCDFQRTIIYDGSWQGQYRTSGQVVASRIEETKVRTLLTSAPAFVVFSKNPWSFNHLVDSIALLAQRRR